MPASKSSWAPLTAAQLEARRIVHVNAETVTDASATDFPGHYGPAQQHLDTWDIDRFRQGLRVQFHQNKPLDASFSLIGVDASIANAFRRILLAEVPTLAIEDVFIFDNTSIIQDEVLAHRLGLIPLQGNHEGLNWMGWYQKEASSDDSDPHAQADDDAPGAGVPNDCNTVVLTLDVECRWATQAEVGRDGRALAKKGVTDPEQRYVNSNIFAHQLKFEPQGQQLKYFTGAGAIKPVNPDILIAKLRPKQRISLRCHCVKGIGMDHAKFSPVATASYRLLPHIDIKRKITGADAKKFQKCFPKGVIKLEEDATSKDVMAVVADPMKDTVSRECLRHDEFKDKVKLGRVRDHFIFSVESTGQMESDELFLDSIRLLRSKAERFKRHLKALQEGH